MSTPYSKVFSSYLSKITDYSYVHLNQDVLEDDLLNLLNSAIIEFEYPKVDIRDKDDVSKIFNTTLNVDEIEILAYLMIDRWMDSQIYNLNLFKQRFSNKDFQFTSQANHLDSLSENQAKLRVKISTLKKKYSYRKMGTYYNIADFSGLSSGD
ncbi:hypothetical protein ACFQZE_07355 [Paenibacillus sp. GCM10027627]|uniref:hypothetical protein n=1 Tax=unclassified Paenibacillus TaxID=185978 RepID=UPI00362906C4